MTTAAEVVPQLANTNGSVSQDAGMGEQHTRLNLVIQATSRVAKHHGAAKGVSRQEKRERVASSASITHETRTCRAAPARRLQNRGSAAAAGARRLG